MDISKASLRTLAGAAAVAFGVLGSGCGGGGGSDSVAPSSTSGFFSVSINGGTGGESTYYASGMDPVLNAAYIPPTDSMPGFTRIDLLADLDAEFMWRTKFGLDFIGSGTGTFELAYSGELTQNGLVYESGMYTWYILTPGIYDPEYFDWYGLVNPGSDATGGSITITEYGPVGGKVAGSYDVTLCDDGIDLISDCAQHELIRLSGRFSVVRGPDGTSQF